MEPIKVKDLISLRFLKLRLIAGEEGINNIVYTTEFYIPGLFLREPKDKIPQNIIPLFTDVECEYLLKSRHIRPIVKGFENAPFLLFTNNCRPDERFLELASSAKIPVLTTPYSATEIIILLGDHLKFVLANRQKLHGTMVNVFGVGIFLRGESGIGKSECALDLVRKGHKLVGDDFVELIAYPEGKLTGRSGAPAENMKYLMELRGIGLIDVLRAYGVASVEDSKIVDIIVELKKVSKEPQSRFKFKETELLGVKLPLVEMVIVPGKNISTVVEALALKYLSKKIGYNPEKLVEDFFKNRLNDKETT